MSTKKQIRANRQNGKKGGVKTQEGKQKVRFNAVKHGILGELITEYEPELSEKVISRFYEQFQPSTAIEEVLVERLSILYLRLVRSAKAEKEYIKSKLEPKLRKVSVGGYMPLIEFEAVKQLHNVFARYETNIKRRFYKTLEQLKSSQDGFVSQKGVNHE